jgi:negative regulator of sigma-B (phosphoserine phosphatase)
MVEMNPQLHEVTAAIDWGVAARALAGQTVSGDLHLVKPFKDGVLFAAVDGLGHGEEALAAAQAAVTVLENNAEEPVTSLVRSCHDSILRTRGVAMTVGALHFRESTLTWLGVGNVQGRLLRAQRGHGPPTESVLLRSGLVGLQIPNLYALVLPVRPGDYVVFATDGVRPEFDQDLFLGRAPQPMADGILSRYVKGNDDALVLVVRCLGD